MRKVLIVLFVVAAVIFALNEDSKDITYSREELEEAKYQAYKRGYDEGEHNARGGLVTEEELTYAYEAGYERGYEEGYDDGYDDAKGGKSSSNSSDLPRIKKDK